MEPKVCIGHVFKCKQNIYRNKQGVIVYKTEMIPIKRKSCPVCSKCCFLNEFIDELMDCDTPPYWDEKPDHNKLYRLIDVEEGRDFDTGEIDLALKFIKNV